MKWSRTELHAHPLLSQVQSNQDHLSFQLIPRHDINMTTK